jgi:hypothetical protein
VVSILFGGSHEDRRDPEAAEAARRQRAAFAADIGDEHGRAWAHEAPRPRRRRRASVLIFIVLVAFAALGSIPLFRSTGGGLLQPNCTTPVLDLSPGRVQAGDQVAWQAAGPDQGRYVVALDSEELRVAGDGTPDAGGGQILGGPFAMSGCRSTQTVFRAPPRSGVHVVTLFRDRGAGYQAVASDTVQVR